MSCPVCDTAGGCVCPALVTSLRAEAEGLKKALETARGIVAHELEIMEQSFLPDPVEDESEELKDYRRAVKEIDAALSLAQPKPENVLLESFRAFMGARPDLRFWQALNAWCGYTIRAGTEDTFYWLCRNGPDAKSGADTCQARAAQPCCWKCATPEQRRHRMILCPTCGNKRCPHATDHELGCSGSNEPGQPGSRWEGQKPEAICPRCSHPAHTQGGSFDANR